MGNRQDQGLLLLRIGIGGMFMWHGWPKLIGGPERWAKVGAAMSTFGIDFFPTGWGLAAALAEALGGALLALGLCVRPATAMMFITMVVAGTTHLQRGDGLAKASHAIELAIVFAALFVSGAGAYKLGKR